MLRMRSVCDTFSKDKRLMSYGQLICVWPHVSIDIRALRADRWLIMILFYYAPPEKAEDEELNNFP